MDKLEGDVGALVQKVQSASQVVENLMDFAHGYWAAAAEDVASSSRDWAAIHAAVRTQAGLRSAGLPLTTQFTP